jgi:hypothetical protein
MLPEGGLAYSWVEPSNVNREGKYRVTSGGEVRLIHILGQREYALLTTDEHPELVSVVRRVKAAHREQPSGVFYINEWRHLLVKAAGGTWYAGSYHRPLEFDLEGSMISAKAPAGLTPGDKWPGPRIGTRYALSASGDDVYCRRKIDARTERTEHLSDYVDDASAFARKMSKHKPGGGRIYINEAREIFAPSANNSFIYLGYAAVHQWFPEPQLEN